MNFDISLKIRGRPKILKTFSSLNLFTDHTNAGSSSSPVAAASPTQAVKDHYQNQQSPTHYTVTASFPSTSGVPEHEYYNPKQQPLQQQRDDSSEDQDESASIGHDYQSDQYNNHFHEQQDGPSPGRGLCLKYFLILPSL